eukprot:31367-Pelagococcus_subviridis.AAC.5
MGWGGREKTDRQTLGERRTFYKNCFLPTQTHPPIPTPGAKRRARRQTRGPSVPFAPKNHTVPRVADRSNRSLARNDPPHSGASHTLVPVRPRWRGERRYLRTLSPGASLRLHHVFNPRPRRLSTSTDAFQLHPDVRSYRTRLTPSSASTSCRSRRRTCRPRLARTADRSASSASPNHTDRSPRAWSPSRSR